MFQIVTKLCINIRNGCLSIVKFLLYLPYKYYSPLKTKKMGNSKKAEATAQTQNTEPVAPVIIVDDNREDISGTLGITEERDKELTAIIEKAWRNHKTITDTMVEISQMVKHQNELVWCIFHLGANVSRKQMIAENPFMALANMFGDNPQRKG